MKRNFSELNIEPMPNPKPLKVQRVSVRIEHTDESGKTSYSNTSEGFITNYALDPAAYTGRQ